MMGRFGREFGARGVRFMGSWGRRLRWWAGRGFALLERMLIDWGFEWGVQNTGESIIMRITWCDGNVTCSNNVLRINNKRILCRS
jgi:hypothetical protein